MIERSMLYRRTYGNPATYAAILGACVAVRLLLEFIARVGRPQSVGEALFQLAAPMLEATFFFVGLYLLARGIHHRVGHSIHCAVCGYEYRAPNKLIKSCPECDQPWLWYGQRVLGRVTRRPALAWTGAVLMLVGGGAYAVRNWESPVIVSQLPTSTLISRILIDPDETPAVWWKTLGRRKVPPADAHRLAGGLLSWRARGQHLSAHASDWLAGFIPDIGSGSGLFERYYRDSVGVRLLIPEEVEAGRTLVVGVECTDLRRGLVLVGYPTLFLSRIEFGPTSDSRAVIARETRLNLMTPSGDLARSSLQVPRDTLAFGDRQRPVEVRLVYWIACLDAESAETEWDADGTPSAVAKAPWARRYESTRTVTVVPWKGTVAFAEPEAGAPAPAERGGQRGTITEPGASPGNVAGQPHDQEALAALQEAVRRDPDSAAARIDLAAAYIERELAEEALRHLEAARDLDPEEPRVYCQLGAAYALLEQPRDAIRHYHRALELDLGQSDAFGQLGQLYVTLGDYDWAETMFREAVRADPDSGSARLQFGRVLLKQGNVREARLQYDRLKDLDAALARQLLDQIESRVSDDPRIPLGSR